MPEKRRKCIVDSFEDASPIVADFIEKYGMHVKVGGTERKVLNGKVIRERSCYDEKSRIIKMDEAKDDIEYAKTFKHEFGHFADDVLGLVSLSEEFENAMDADKYWTDKSTALGDKNFSKMIADLKNYDVMDSMYISDILSGFFLNDTKMIEAYEKNGMSFYGHDNNTYWFAWEKEEKIVQRETFANLFAIYASGDRNKCTFIEKWFPNTTGRFKKMLEEKIDGGKKF